MRCATLTANGLFINISVEFAFGVRRGAKIDLVYLDACKSQKTTLSVLAHQFNISIKTVSFQ